MTGAWTIFRRELKSALTSPIAVIVIIAFLLISGGLFMSQFFLAKSLDMRFYFNLLPYLLAVILPAISMRLWAEDRQLNTLELLLSLPLSPGGLVLGKFLGALASVLLMLAATWTIPAMLFMLGRPDPGPIASGYLGAALLAALFLAIGQFVSGFCRDQIVAFILGLAAALGLLLIGTDFIAATVDGWWPGLGGLLQQQLGVAAHLGGFEKGVVDLRDLLYFLVLTAVFLLLNGFWIEGRLRPRAKAAFATACVVCIGIAMSVQGIAQQLPLGRADWTANRAYAVSAVSRELLRGLELPVTVKLYLSPSEKMPTPMRTLERDLRDTLDELRLAGGGKFQYQIFHMEATAALAGEAEKPEGPGDSPEATLGRKGIRPFQVQSIEEDEVGVRLVYAAASIAYKDQPEELIPQLVPTMLDQFEYLLMSRIARLVREEPLMAAVVAPYEERGIDPNLLAMLQGAGMNLSDRQLQDDYRYLPAMLRHEGYQVSRIRLTEQQPIPPKSSVLVLVEPGTLNDRQRYEINRFLVEGGTLFLAAQRYLFRYQQRDRGIAAIPEPQEIGVDPLLATWGVEISREILLDEEAGTVSVSTGSVGPFAISVPVKAPVQAVVGQSQMNQELAVTAQLPPIFYLGGSPLMLQEERLKNHGLTVTTLMTSSPRSRTMSLSEYQTFAWASAAPTVGSSAGGRLPLAVWVRGAFPDHYAGQPVPAWPKAESKTPPAEGEVPAERRDGSAKQEEPSLASAPLTPKPGQLILVGCIEMFKNELAGSGGHLKFFLNAVDTLATGGRLVAIRNKQPALRVMTTPSTATKAWLRFLTLGLMPLMVAGLWLGYAAWRRRGREAYLRTLNA